MWAVVCHYCVVSVYQDGTKCLVKWKSFGLEKATWKNTDEMREICPEKFAYVFSPEEIRLKLVAAEAQPLKK